MDSAQKLLFGQFPRAVGTPYQWVVHSEGEFDVYYETVNGYRNVYASVSWRPIGGDRKLDKVSIDLDTPQKDVDWPSFDLDEPADDLIVARMYDDPDFADTVLGPVVEDARKLAQGALDMGICPVGVFSGLGIHVHLLYRETGSNLSQKLGSTSRMIVGKYNLETADQKVGLNGDHNKIMRVPNAERVHVDEDRGVHRGAGLYTIPLKPSELKEITVEELLDWSQGPRLIDVPDDIHRPEMSVHDEYINTQPSQDNVEQRDLDRRSVEDSLLSFVLEEYLQMPCMYERIQQPEPDHKIRQNCAVLLFNLGMTPQEVTHLYRQIGWVDWNEKITKRQLNQIYNSGYADMSCASIRRNGWCTVPEDGRDPEVDAVHECPTYGWSGGRAEWK